ncbi:hypothetical protein N7540_005652 [Penicillium herquei]|nr:hypothetical protein N7540_005652 [Penicillium herquei]
MTGHLHGGAGGKIVPPVLRTFRQTQISNLVILITSFNNIGNHFGVPIRDKILKSNLRLFRATTKTIVLVGGSAAPQHLGKIGNRVAATTSKSKIRESKNRVRVLQGVNENQITTPIFGRLLVGRKNAGKIKTVILL